MGPGPCGGQGLGCTESRQHREEVPSRHTEAQSLPLPGEAGEETRGGGLAPPRSPRNSSTLGIHGKLLL